MEPITTANAVNANPAMDKYLLLILLLKPSIPKMTAGIPRMTTKPILLEVNRARIPNTKEVIAMPEMSLRIPLAFLAFLDIEAK